MAIYKGQVNLVNVNDGVGRDGIDGLSFMLGTYSATIPCTSDGFVIADTTITIPFTVFQGNSRLACTANLLNIGPDISSSVTPGTANSEGIIKLVFLKGSDLGIQTSESLTITITATNSGKSATQEFTYSKVMNGQTGKDGEDGEDGKDGVDAQSFSFETNQAEILKFVTTDGTLSFSPEVLNLSIYKKELSLESGQTIIKNLSPANLSVRVFNTVSGTWLELTTEAKNSLVSVGGEEATFLEFNLLGFSNLAESEESARIFTEGESVIEFIYVYSQGEDTYRMSSYIYFRYGMNKDMASLSLEANGIVASIQNSSLEFNANGLTVNNGSIRILNKEGKEVLVGDSQTGNLTLSGTVYAEDGQFNGTVYATDGKFTGIIEATDGYFNGELKAVSGKIGGFEIRENQLISTDNLDSPSITLDGEKG